MKITKNLKELEKRLIGRSVYENDALSLCWSLSGFEASFAGERAEIAFVPDITDDQPVYVMTIVDGVETITPLSTGRDVVLLEQLGGGSHTLTFRRLSEGDNPIKVASLSVFGEDCGFLPPPAAPEKRIEFFGDSITCGFGDLGEAADPDFRTYQEDPTRTYAGLTASKLGMDIRVEAISGQGIIKNCAGEVGFRIPDFFSVETRHGREEHDFTSWVPDIVVVNAGTNDCGGGVPDDEFRDGAGKFIEHIREVYPTAEIFWVYGMMGLRYDAVLSSVISDIQKRDSHVHYVPVRPIYEMKDETGSCGHPNLNGQARAAGILIKAIRDSGVI